MTPRTLRSASPSDPDEDNVILWKRQKTLRTNANYWAAGSVPTPRAIGVWRSLVLDFREGGGDECGVAVLWTNIHTALGPLPTPQVAGLASDFDFALVPQVKSHSLWIELFWRRRGEWLLFQIWLCVFGGRATVVAAEAQLARRQHAGGNLQSCQRSHREKGSPRQGTVRGCLNLATICGLAAIVLLLACFESHAASGRCHYERLSFSARKTARTQRVVLPRLAWTVR
ncbi:hypothetical protein AG1IA_04244 [Rhizoctonia solani AG-1 IA]|uniref:Uncharacterized protein n=1 Tax=Thanatephorus cucumeris (strain AG1-IA) TaxID=983506 RepID=L8WY34_THACA|nr:hypothetical protein AG1IA_04244 [Rhizoctonia solani AG-1 IA]